MTMSGYSNAFVDLMLGWLKGFANWVLRLFNLAGSASGSPLLWLSENWLKLLVFFLVLGIVLDRLVWLIRWRPYWVWFRKERVIVNDDKFFAGEDLFEADSAEAGDKNADWGDRDYVVASTLVERKSGVQGKSSVVQGQRRTNKSRMNLKRPAAKATPSEAPATPRSHEMRREPGEKISAKDVPMPTADELFGVDNSRPGVSDFYEDEVFNVSNLPVPDEFQGEDQVQ